VASILKRADGNNVLLSRFRNAMSNSIFDEWLQNESGNRAASDIRINLKFKLNPLSKTSFLNADKCSTS